MKPRVLNSRAVGTGTLMGRLLVWRKVRMSDPRFLERLSLLPVERPVRRIVRLATRHGLGAAQVAMTKAGVWTTHRLTTLQQLRKALEPLPKGRLARVLHELEG